MARMVRVPPRNWSGRPVAAQAELARAVGEDPSRERLVAGLGGPHVVEQGLGVGGRVARAILGQQERVKRPRSVGGVVGLGVLEMPADRLDHAIARKSRDPRVGVTGEARQGVDCGELAFCPDLDREESIGGKQCAATVPERGLQVPDQVRLIGLAETRAPQPLLASFAGEKRRVGRAIRGIRSAERLEMLDPVGRLHASL